MRRRWKIVHGDCVEVMMGMEPDSIDAIVTDPPYGLKFMGKSWDDMGHGSEQQAWHYRWTIEALRVLKPGGHLLAFGGTRTYHRLASAVEDAGFEIRDQIQWLYGTGFPKSHNVANAIDKSVGHPNRGSAIASGSKFHPTTREARRPGDNLPKYESRSEESQQWEGWGTALKPAHEPIVVARKPLIGTVAKNVLEHGTGGLNIDATRVGPGHSDGNGRDGEATAEQTYADKGSTNFAATPGPLGGAPEGRWPANVILDEEAGAMLDEQTGDRPSGSRNAGMFAGSSGSESLGNYGEFGSLPIQSSTGGPSRFFYCPKANKKEREAGLDNFVLSGGSAGDVTVRDNTNPVCSECGKSKIDRGNGECSCTNPQWVAKNTQRANTHPTVKPIALMEYLIRLATPPGGIVLDPFVGSGTTGIAATNQGFKFVGVELESEYVDLSKARIKHSIKERQ